MVDKYKNEFEIMKTRLKEIDFYLEKEKDRKLSSIEITVDYFKS